MRFKWTASCFHCEGDHQRKACPEFREILRQGNVGKKEAAWKLPSGYKGAFEKAKERWQRSQPEGRINEFLGMDSEDESYSDIEIPMGKINAFTAVRNRTPRKYASKHAGSEGTTALSNHLDALQDEQLDMSNDLSGWAHTIQISKLDHGSKS